MKFISLLLTALFAFGSAHAEEVHRERGLMGEMNGALRDGPGDGPVAPGWTAKKDNCICGISDLRKVSNPAKVDYDTLLDSTPQMKEIKKKKIDPQSREGRALKSKAKTLVTRTCETVQRTKGHCGVWKKISHSDKRVIADITTDISAEF